jgi:hypothetical protein
MALKDLLAQLPEDFKIKNGETELNRAAILAEFDKEVAPLNTRVTELTSREQELKEQLDAAIAAARLRTDDSKKAETVDPRQQMLDAMKGILGEKDKYDFGDPYSKQLIEEVRNIVKSETSGLSTAQQAELEELKKGNMGLAAMVLMHQMNADFAAHKWPEGYDASKAWSEAIRQGYIDPNTKLPNVARFNRELMAPIEAKTAADKRYEEGIEAGKKLAQEEMRARQTGRGRLGLVPRPGGGAVGGGKQGAAAAPRNLAEAIDQIAISDADIAANTGLRAG